MNKTSSLLLLWIVAAAVPTVAQAELLVRFDDTVLLVEGAAAGAEVAVLGIGRDREGFLPRQTSVWEVLVADSTGVAILDLGRTIPTESSWVVVDLGDGESVLAAPSGTVLRQVDFPGRGLPAALRTLDDQRRSLAVLWVRPSSDAAAGAWGGAIHDGSDLDGDGKQDRSLRILLDRLQPLGTSELAPEVLAEGDVVVGIDPESLEIYVVRVGS